MEILRGWLPDNRYNFACANDMFETTGDYVTQRFKTCVPDTWLPLFTTFLVQIVHFDQGNPDRVVFAAHDGRVISRGKCSNDGAFPIITRR